MQRFKDVFFAVIGVALLLLILALLQGCAAFRGMSDYDGPEDAAPNLVLGGHIQPRIGDSMPAPWAIQRYMHVNNPRRDTIKISIRCSVSEFPDLIIPPRTTQTCLLDSADVTCYALNWSVVP